MKPNGLVDDTFAQPYDEKRFCRRFIKNLFDEYEEINSSFDVPSGFEENICSCNVIAKYSDPDSMRIDVLVVKLKLERSLENARTMQRNFIAKYLKETWADAALVAFYYDGSDNWRFSLVQLGYVFDKGKIEKDLTPDLTPARRCSFLVGKGENIHTAKQVLASLLTSSSEIKLTELEDAFSIEAIEEEFFKKYKGLYYDLKDDLSKYEKFKTKNIDAADFAKQLLGQVVFLYFLQKKGWLGVKKGEDWGTGAKNFLKQLFKREEYKNFFDDVLKHLLYDALATERQTTDNFFSHPNFNCKIPFLNGGLFEPIKDYDWEKETLSIDNNIFKKIFKAFDTYNFTVREDEPLDKEVAIDPEMLGKVFENLIAENEKKDTGTYYTPREIVHYMCQESLTNYLDAKLNINNDKYSNVVEKDDIDKFICHGEIEGEIEGEIADSIKKNAKAIDAALEKVKICDPAIGSGAFPVGVMSEIVKARILLNKHLGQQQEHQERSEYEFKRHAIQESIYGVDIQPSAVDIAKLRLWLSLVVDENDFSDTEPLPLPNLDYKIVAGNSLLNVDIDLFNRDALRTMEELKEEFFNTTSFSRKKELRDSIEAIISDLTKGNARFDIRLYFSEVFHNNGGFDILIANPPYIGEKGHKEKFKEMKNKRQKLSKFYKGRMDYYFFFFHLCLELSNEFSQIAFITTSYFITATYAVELRKDLYERATIRRLIDFNELKIFQNAKGQHDLITILSRFKNYPHLTYTAKTPLKKDKDTTPSEMAKILAKILKGECNSTEYNSFASDKVFEGYDKYIRLKIADANNPSLLGILDKIKSKGISLNDIANINRGVISGCNRAFVLDKKREVAVINSFNEEEKLLLRPFFKGKDVSNYKNFTTLEKNSKLLLYISSKHIIDSKSYPNVYKHLTRYKEILSDRREAKNHKIKWYELQWARNERLFLGDKILVPYRAKSNIFSPNNTEWFCSDDICIIKLKKKLSYEYLAAILASKLIRHWLNNKGKKQGETLQLLPKYLKQIPIPSNFINQEEIIKLVKECQKLDNEKDQAQIKICKNKIDQLVYQIYKLSKQEIEIIENYK